MKKIISFFLFVLLLIPCVFVLTGAQTADYGETVTVEITISETKKIQAGSVEFVFDTNVFELKTAEWNLASSPMLADINIENCQGVFAYGSNKTVKGTIIATFLIKEGVSYEEYCIQTNLVLTNKEGTEFAIDVPAFTVTVACDHTNVTEVPYEAPTCTRSGFTEGTFCKDCEIYLTGHEEIPMIACDFSAEIAGGSYFAKEQSCTHGDLYYKSCSMCGKRGTETFDVGEGLGHIGGEATCTEPAACTRCGEGYGDLLPHTLGDEATCLTAQICTVCETVMQDALGHDYASVVTAPTCTEEGYTTHTCKRCGNVEVNTQTAPLGHDHRSVVTAPTCTEQGYVTYICNACSYTYVGDYSKPFGHAMMEEIVKPTCTEQGYTLHFCTRCKDESFKDTFVDPIGHLYSDEVVPPTCTEDGFTVHVCENCQDAYKDAEVQALGHDYESVVTAPTCLETGITTHTCKRCQDVYEDAKTDALGHDYESVVTAPTCLETGITTHTCKRCQDVYEDAKTDALGHDYESVVTAPTCIETGITTHTCKRCQDVYTDAKTDALGHTYDGEQDPDCNTCGEIREIEGIFTTGAIEPGETIVIGSTETDETTDPDATAMTGGTDKSDATKAPSNNGGGSVSFEGCNAALSGSLAIILLTCGAAIMLIRKKED